MESLTSQRRRVEELRAAGTDAPGLVDALLELAEIEPVFALRAAPVRALLQDAAARLAAVPSGASADDRYGRMLVRLAATQIADEVHDDADATLVRAVELLPEGHLGRLEAAALAARSALRRGARSRAEEIVRDIAPQLGPVPTSLAERRAVLTAAAAVAELLYDQAVDEAAAMFADILSAIGDDDRLLDLAFLAHQALAVAKLERGDEGGLHHLRAVVKITRDVGAPSDEIHARIAMAGFLTERGDETSLEEAGRHLQIARDRALDHNLDDLHMLTLVSQAGFLARRGKVRGALDRCLEIARSAADRKDVLRYVGAVALMSTIYELKGDLPSAYRALAEAEHGLGQSIGVEYARTLFRPHLHGLADRMGRPRFLEMLDEIRAAQELGPSVDKP